MKLDEIWRRELGVFLQKFVIDRSKAMLLLWLVVSVRALQQQEQNRKSTCDINDELMRHKSGFLYMYSFYRE